MGNQNAKPTPNNVVTEGIVIPPPQRPNTIRDYLGLPRTFKGLRWYVYVYWGFAVFGLGLLVEKKLNGELPPQKEIYEVKRTIPKEQLTPELIEKLRRKKERLQKDREDTLRLLRPVSEQPQPEPLEEQHEYVVAHQSESVAYQEPQPEPFEQLPEPVVAYQLEPEREQLVNNLGEFLFGRELREQPEPVVEHQPESVNANQGPQPEPAREQLVNNLGEFLFGRELREQPEPVVEQQSEPIIENQSEPVREQSVNIIGEFLFEKELREPVVAYQQNSVVQNKEY